MNYVEQNSQTALEQYVEDLQDEMEKQTRTIANLRRELKESGQVIDLLAASLAAALQEMGLLPY